MRVCRHRPKLVTMLLLFPFPPPPQNMHILRQRLHPKRTRLDSNQQPSAFVATYSQTLYHLELLAQNRMHHPPTHQNGLQKQINKYCILTAPLRHRDLAGIEPATFRGPTRTLYQLSYSPYPVFPSVQCLCTKHMSFHESASCDPVIVVPEG